MFTTSVQLRRKAKGLEKIDFTPKINRDNTVDIRALIHINTIIENESPEGG